MTSAASEQLVMTSAASEQLVIDILNVCRDIFEKERHNGGQAVDLIMATRGTWALKANPKNIYKRCQRVSKYVSEYGRNEALVLPDVTASKRQWEAQIPCFKHALKNSLAASHPPPAWWPDVPFVVFDLAEDSDS